VKQICDFPVPLLPKKSVTKPDWTPPPNKISKDFDPVLTIIININPTPPNKPTGGNLHQRKLFIVGAVSLNFSEQLIVFLDVATSTQKTSHNLAARDK
jgi:hypothetical protein